MAVIGQINTIVSATTKPLTGALNRAAGSFKTFGSRITGMIGGLGRLGGSLLAVAGAAGFGAMVKSSFDTIDSLAKTSDALGITTEALAGLRRAGELSGVSSDKLDKSIFRMQRSISDASQGLSTATRDFDLMGVSIDNIRSLSPEEQFIQVAEAISKIPDQTDKTRVAMDTFGRDGARVLKLVEGGAQSLRDEIAKAGALGLAPSREDAAKIEAANDAMTDMKSAFMGIANTVAISIAPSITSMAGNIQAFGQRVRDVFKSIAPIIRQVGAVWSSIFSKAWELVKTVFDLIGITGTNTFTSIRDTLLDFFITAEFAFKNIGPIAELLWEKIKLGALTFWEDTKFLFTTQIPEVLNWFANNWRDIFFTTVDFTLTLFENLGKNLRAIWSAVLDFISGKGFHVNWTPLTEGFKNTIKEMPEISTREFTAVEKELQGRVKTLSTNLGADLAAFTEQRRAELLPPEQQMAETDTEGAQDLADTLGETIAENVKGAVEGPTAVQRGSAEAFSAILAAQRNQNEPIDKVAKTGEKQLAVQESQLTILKKLERSGGIDLIGGEV